MPDPQVQPCSGPDLYVLPADELFPPPPISYEDYLKWYQYSLNNNTRFWQKAGYAFINWRQPFTKILTHSKAEFFTEQEDCVESSDSEFESPLAKKTELPLVDDQFHHVAWFKDGLLNVCENVLDLHDPHHIALIWEADEPCTGHKLTFGELKDQVCQLSNFLSHTLTYLQPGVDVVTIYMGMVPQAVVAMLACARVGLTHNVVFAGFSAEALAERILDSNSKLLITADYGFRGGKPIHIKKTVDEALALLCPNSMVVKNVLLVQRNPSKPLDVPLFPERDLLWHDVVPQESTLYPPPAIKSEHPLFVLYTSGSTGKPKGVLHTSAGYLLYAKMTAKYVFDLQPGDNFGCMADIGWITGHSYVVYGPLANGVAVTLFESVPTYPTPSRYWQMVEKYQLSQLYTAPTVIRLLKASGDSHIKGYDLSSLRVLGSVGEPIHADTWKWFFETVGQGRCTLVDTYWQTETGGIVISALPGGMPTMPGSASLPFFGIEPALMDHDGLVIKSSVTSSVSGILTIARPWPGMARTILNNDARFCSAYLKPYPGYFFTGDGAIREHTKGLYFLTGRVDDVINVSGHRLSSREIENALMKLDIVSESAVVGEDDQITGQSLTVIIGLKSYPPPPNITLEIKEIVRSTIGPIATPRNIVILSETTITSAGGLPKTRSGKIMRRILRIIIQECRNANLTDLQQAKKTLMSDMYGGRLGDLSTLNNPSVIQFLIDDILQFCSSATTTTINK